MRFSVLRESGRNLARGCAVLMVAGAAAGCSSQVSRFSDGIDMTSTASTDNQRAIIQKQPVAQPYPGDPVTAAPVDGSYTQSVSRSSIEPIKVQSLPPVAQSTSAPVANPVRTASLPARPNLDNTATGTVKTTTEKPFKQAAPEAPRMASEDGEPKGWSRAGGTQITIREGETVYNLSRRYGVPADVIMKTNGLATADGLQVGQKVVIPTYVYSRKAPVSAPDHNPKVADARSSRGEKSEAPAEKLPLPARSANEKVAVLPQQPKLKGEKVAASLDASANGAKAKDAKIASAQAKADTYTVQPGDSLSAVSRKTGVSVAALKQANGMQDGLIRIGQTLKVPNGHQATVASAAPAEKAKPVNLDPVKTASTPPPAKATPTETLTAYTPPKKAEKLIKQAAEDDDVAAPDSTGIGKMRWPVRGRVISAFGSGGQEGDGIDIAVPEGTPIKAAENGVVIYAGNGLKEFGNTVLVRHEDGLVTVYGHASSLEVQRGQKVKRGQEIAQSGMSGSADSPKLHFEVRKNSAPVDPRTFLE
jgi:murein DD-endopeptidase MepM/ murein hydrolase activator NlpD